MRWHSTTAHDQTIQLDPKNAISYASRCAAHIKKGETDQALSDCNQAIQLDSKNAMAYANRCAAHFNKGETDRAQSDCNQAIQLDPKNAMAYANRCAAHFNKGETDLALSDCNHAIQLDPKNAMGFHNRAAGYSAKGDYDRAIDDLDQVIQLDPKDAKAFNDRGVGYAAGDYDRAFADYDQAIQLDPKSAINNEFISNQKLFEPRWGKVGKQRVTDTGPLTKKRIGRASPASRRARASRIWRRLSAWADTTTPHGRLMLTVLGGLAEFERELIKARTEEGRKRAQARGVRFGRKLKLSARDRNPAPALPIASRVFKRSLVERASLSSRVTSN
jgi:tetratricopeptide (TPR) repeat protein